jgi:hypothetical protein
MQRWRAAWKAALFTNKKAPPEKRGVDLGVKRSYAFVFRSNTPGKTNQAGAQKIRLPGSGTVAMLVSPLEIVVVRLKKPFPVLMVKLPFT